MFENLDFKVDKVSMLQHDDISSEDVALETKIKRYFKHRQAAPTATKAKIAVTIARDHYQLKTLSMSHLAQLNLIMQRLLNERN